MTVVEQHLWWSQFLAAWYFIGIEVLIADYDRRAPVVMVRDENGNHYRARCLTTQPVVNGVFTIKEDPNA